MDELIKQLEKLNFSKVEASVYLTLLKGGSMSGYKIAKLLNVARPSVYDALETLYRKGAVYLIQGDTNVYEHKDPKVLIETLKKELIDSMDLLEKSMAEYSNTSIQKQYLNIEGEENIVRKCKEILRIAKKEVYINMDWDLELFAEEFKELNKKGVRIIIFSFSELESKGLPVELYINNVDSVICKDKRIMLVVDNKSTIIASNGHGEYLGVFTENSLLTSIVSEHIHHDIYLLKLRKRYGKELIDDEIRLGTLNEKDALEE